MKLGINTGFALNRFSSPEQWLKVVNGLGLDTVQLTADLINPLLDIEILDELIKRINITKAKYGINIDSVMTGAFTRVNHFSHPDKKIRLYWQRWFRRLADIAVQLGATNLSSHLGILCYDDLFKRRNYIFKETINAWKDLAIYGKRIGLKYLSWEPMSIKREYGESFEEVIRIQKEFENTAIPIKLCLDVGHSTDYRGWIKRFGKESPLIHLKQVIKGSSAHHPFIGEYNAKGEIRKKEFIELINKYCNKETLLLFEFSFRERKYVDSLVLKHLEESARYWLD